MKRHGIVFVILLTLFAISTPAMALTPFKTAFKKKYVDKHTDTAFQDAFKKEGCHVCHVHKAKKVPDPEKHLNAFGQELAKIIEGNANERIKNARKNGGKEEETAEKEKIAKELEKAFEEVAKKKSKSGETFGELIKAGKLPGADAKDS